MSRLIHKRGGTALPDRSFVLVVNCLFFLPSEFSETRNEPEIVVAGSIAILCATVQSILDIAHVHLADLADLAALCHFLLLGLVSLGYPTYSGLLEVMR